MYQKLFTVYDMKKNTFKVKASKNCFRYVLGHYMYVEQNSRKPKII